MKGNQMCDKCGGKGYYSEEVKSFDRATFRSLFQNVKDFAEQGIEQYDAAESDTGALLALGQYLLVSSQTMAKNLQTVMQFCVDQMEKDPELMTMVLSRVVDKALAEDGGLN
jgi:hypothetical protein